MIRHIVFSVRICSRRAMGITMLQPVSRQQPCTCCICPAPRRSSAVLHDYASNIQHSARYSVMNQRLFEHSRCVTSTNAGHDCSEVNSFHTTSALPGLPCSPSTLDIGICHRRLECCCRSCLRSQNAMSTTKSDCRTFTMSAKAIVDASPLLLQPYLRLIRLDRPIGKKC